MTTFRQVASIAHNLPKMPSIQQILAAKLGEPELVSNVITMNEFLIRADYNGDYRRLKFHIVECIDKRGHVQCLHSGKIYYRRDCDSLDDYRSLADEMVETAKETSIQYELEEFNAILIEGDPVAMEVVGHAKSRKMIEENRIQVENGRRANAENLMLIDLTAHKKKMKFVLSDLNAYFGLHVPEEVEQDVWHEEDNGRPKPNEKEFVPTEEELEYMYQKALYIDDDGEIDFGNLNFYDMRFSLKCWSCTDGWQGW